MQPQQRFTIQTEIRLEQLYQIIRQLPLEQQFTIADQIKQQALRQQWQALSGNLPDVPEITEEEILAEVDAVRTERYHHRTHQ
jgi:hypothetical protein